MGLTIRQNEAWANKLPRSVLSDQYERSLLKNSLEESCWYIENDADETFYVVQWDNYDIPSKWLVFSKELLLSYCGGYVDKYQNIVTNISSLKTFLGDTKRFFIKLNNFFEEEALGELSIEEVSSILQSLAVTEEDGLKSKATVTGFSKVINALQKAYREGALSDGFLFDMPGNFIEYFYKDFVESMGVDYPIWNKGGSYGGVPVSLAMYILAYSLQVLRSDKTKIAKKYFSYVRKGILPHKFILEWKSNKGEYRSSVVKCAYSNDRKFSKEARQLIDEINKEVADEYRDWFFDGGLELNQHVSKVYDCSVIAICILTGYRISELRHLLPSYLDYDNEKKVFTLKTNMIKTNKGLGTIRSFSDEGAEIIGLLLEMHVEDKMALDIPIFARTHRNTTRGDAQKAVPYNTMLHCFKDGYQAFLSDQGRHFEDVLESISPHNLRHNWVDMALRCFLPEKDHSVLSEEIRQHLRHKYGSTWTRKYMDGKFTPVHMRELEERYLEDLINRAAGEEAEDFVGPVVVRIKNKVKEKIEFICIDEAIDETVRELLEELIHIEGHPWGLCVLFHDTQTQAKCFDKETSTPKYEESSSFENCSGCIHRLSHKSMKEDIIRFVLAHEDFLAGYPISSGKLIATSKEAVRVGRKIVEDMES